LSPAATLLVGSPRGVNSTSHSLGSYLLEKLENGGYVTTTFYVHTAHRQPEVKTALFASVADSDLLIIAFPLYIDCLPAPMIWALEEIAQQRKNKPSSKVQRLLAIVNNGFPEASQNATAIAICRQFATETGFDWAGGLSLGGGGGINGSTLKEAGYMARNITKSLDLAAKNLLANEAVSEEAVALMAKPLVPKPLYVFIGNYSWKRQAKKLGTQKRLYDRPAEKL
jgi:hypothetical protein